MQHFICARLGSNSFLCIDTFNSYNNAQGRCCSNPCSTDGKLKPRGVKSHAPSQGEQRKGPGSELGQSASSVHVAVLCQPHKKRIVVILA